METTKIEFTRVNNDKNGNPRYVCHFLELLNGEKNNIENLYEIALKKAKKIGGRKFNNKQFGGGIVFKTDNIAQTEKNILNLKNQ